MSFKAYIDLVVKAYPQLEPVWKKTIQSDVPLDDLRKQLYQKRAQYWYAKFGTIKPTWNAAKADACYVLSSLKAPSTISYRNFAVGLVWGVQVYGCWKLGEIIARGHIGGYPVGDWAGAPHIKNQHH